MKKRTSETLDQDIRGTQLQRTSVLLDQRSITASNSGLTTRGRSPGKGRVSVRHHECGGS